MDGNIVEGMQDDIRNWTLMCSLGCDFLFEHNHIQIVNGTVQEGRGIISPDLFTHISSLIGKRVSNWTSAEAYYVAKADAAEVGKLLS